jgi:hypothetical protein
MYVTTLNISPPYTQKEKTGMVWPRGLKNKTQFPARFLFALIENNTVSLQLIDYHLMLANSLTAFLDYSIIQKMPGP